MPELVAKIGADASQLVRETKKAGGAFAKLRAGVQGNTDKARNALGQFSTQAQKDAAKVTKAVGGIGEAFNEVRDSIKKGNLKGALGGLAKGARSAASGLGGLVGGVNAFSLLRRGAGLALDAVTALGKGLLVVGVGLAGIGAKATAEFSRFQSAFNQVRTLIDEGNVDVARLDRGVRGLATQFGGNLVDSTRAAYQAISAGVEPGKVVEFLGTAFKGAAAGAASVGEITDLLTSTLNAFQKPASEAAAVSDVFFATIKAGKTTASELAQSIGQVAPVAAAANVSLEALGASLATLTASGLSTAESSTQVKALLIELQKPSAKTAGLLQQIGVNAATIGKAGLEGTLKKLRDGAKRLGLRFTDLFSNTRAIQAATSLAGSGYEKFIGILGQTNNAAGAAADAFEKTSKQLALSFGKLRAQVQNAFVQLGRVLAPALRPAIEAVSDFVGKATADFDAFAEVAKGRFGESFKGLFDSISSSSLASGNAVTQSVRAIGNALNSVGNLVARNADTFGVLAAIVKGATEQLLISANVTRAILGGALFFVLRPLALVIQALGRLVDFIPGIGSGLADAGDSFAEFADTLGGEALDSVGNVVDGYKEIADLGNFADKSAASAKRAAGSLRGFGAEALSLADKTDKLRVKQAAEAEAAEKQRIANDNAASSSAKSAVSQDRLGSATQGAAAGARNAAAGMTQLERANAASLSTFQKNAVAISKQTDSLRDSIKQAAALRAEFAKLRDQNLFGRDADRASELDKSTSAFNEFAVAVDLVEAGSRKLAEGFGGLQTAQQAAIGTTQLLGEALRASSVRLNLAENLDTADFEQTLERAKGRVEAFAILLTGEAKASFDVLAESFEKGGISAAEFLQQTESLTEPFTALRESVLQASNVLRGPFQAAADQLIVKLDKGKISTKQFSVEIQGLVDAQGRAALGFTELFRSVDAASGSFQRLNASARAAKGALADDIRTQVQGLRLDLEAGEITLDQYLAGLSKLGDESARFQRLSESQLVVVNQLREGNGALADRVLALAGTLSGAAATSFATYLEAFRQQQLSASELGVALDRVVRENNAVAASAEDVARGSKKAADGLRDQTRAAKQASSATSSLNESTTKNTRSLADFLQVAARGTPLESTLDGIDLRFNMGQISASEYRGQLEQLFGAIKGGAESFVNATASSRLFSEGQTRLIPKIDELGSRLGEVGKSQLKILIERFGEGATTAGEFRQALQQLADSAARAGREAAKAGQSLSVFGGSGGIQAQRRASGGSQLFGFAGTATGSSSFTSQLEQQVGDRLGLKPKALRQRVARTPGGLRALAEETGVGRFASGGPVLSTGQATVEAGEHVLNNQGLNGLGRLIADLVNKGQGDTLQQTFNNTFSTSVGGDADGGVDERRLAMALAPEFARMGSLAAARSPIT